MIYNRDSGPFMLQDIIFTLRSLWRSKFFALTALIAFSFGIGATATVFSVVDAILLHPAGFIDQASMIAVKSNHKNEELGLVSPAVFDRLRSRTEVFSQVAAVRTSILTVTRVPNPDQLFGLTVSGNYFGLVNAAPLRGRVLGPQDDRPGAPPVLLLSYKAWQQLFNGDPNVVGRSAQVDGDLYTVIGVMPSTFTLPAANSGGLLWTTLRMTPAEIEAGNSRGLQVVARLRPTVSMSSAQHAMDAIATAISEAGTDSRGPLYLHASAITYDTDAQQRATLWMAMGMVCGLLLIGCSNLSSVLLARSISRRRDYAIRLATGATRMQLIRQSLIEVFLLAFASLAIACAGTYGALSLIRDHLTTIGAGIPYLSHVQLNMRSLFFSFAIALLSALLCGTFPAVASTSIDLASGLRETGTLIDSRKNAHRFLRSLLAIEAGISLLLLLDSGLLVRSLTRMLSEDHGLRPDHVLTMRLPTGAWHGLSRKKTPEEQAIPRAEYMQLLAQVQQTPGVQAAALSSSLPLSHVMVTTISRVPGQSEPIYMVTQAVTRDYFRAMGIPIISGETFAPGASAKDRPYAIVNQAFVSKYFNEQNPVGRFLLDEDGQQGAQVIGVAKDSPDLDLNEAVAPEMYIDFEQTTLMPFLTGMAVRTEGNPSALIQTLRHALALKNSEQPVVQVKTLQTLIDENTWQPRFSAWLASAFALIALCMCGIGIYGVVAYISAARQRDFGIRVALGAERANLLRLAAMESLTPVVIGSCLGLVGFYFTGKYIASLLYKTSPFDGANILVSAAVLLVLALAASARPAMRAASVDPAITLRHE